MYEPIPIIIMAMETLKNLATMSLDNNFRYIQGEEQKHD